MSKKKNKAKSDLAKYMEVCPISTLSVTRYTFDAWMRCYPGSNREEYEEKQKPYNLMEYLCDAYAGSIDALEKHPDLEIKVTLLDDDYFKWLGNAENTPEKRASYHMTEEERIEKLAENKLNISEWAYSVPIIGITQKKLSSSVIDTDKAERFAEYLGSIIDDPDFSVYVAPYILKCDSYCNNAGRIFSMAHAWFDEGRQVKFGQFASISFKAPNVTTVLNIPVVVRETNPSGNIKASDLLAYMGVDQGFDKEDMRHQKKGWHLDCIDLSCNADQPDWTIFKIEEAFIDSKAGKDIVDQIKHIFLDQYPVGESIQYMLNLEDIPEFYVGLVNDLGDQIEKSGRTVYYC